MTPLAIVNFGYLGDGVETAWKEIKLHVQTGK